MTLTPVPIANGFYVSDSLPISHQQCQNFVPVIQQAPSLSVSQLIGSPGIRQIVDSGGGAADVNRGMHKMGTFPYTVNGTVLYRIDRALVAGVETFSLVSLGTVEGSNRVSMADNGTQLMILVPGGKGYIYSVSGGFVEITDPDFRANGDPQYVVFIDGYFACSTDSKTWIVSNLNDGTAWDALDFGSAESDPDKIVAPIVHANQIFLTGSETTESFQNIGGSGFPFQRSNIYLDKGCYAPFSLISTNQRFFMIGGGKDEGPAVWAYQGGTYNKVSTLAIDNVMSEYSEAVLNAAFALSWSKKGQYFVAFSFPDRTFVFNMTTNIWHELTSSIENEEGDFDQERWRVNSLVSAYNYIIVGDNQDGRIGILDVNEYGEYGNNIIRIFSTQPLINNTKSFRIPSIELTLEAGIGNGVADPLVSMAISENAKTFDYERSRKIGMIGKYGQRTVWRKNGRVPRFCVLRFRISDQIKAIVIRLDMDLIP